MMPKQKDSSKIIVCCFVVGIVVMSIISIKSFSIYDIGYLSILIFYFLKYLYINRRQIKSVNKD